MKKKHKKLDCFEVPIIGGKFKGKKILIPKLSTTRSSKSILRESLFNTLQFDIANKNFVEVFAGSGSVGIEALSRDAKDVYFIERGTKAYDVLSSNIDSLEVSNAHLYKADSFAIFEQIHQQLQADGAKSYFYFDPPFNTRTDMQGIYKETISLISSIDPSICEMAIIEHISSLELPNEIGKLKLKKSKRFGKSTLSYYQASS